jgi:hypothetical protein
MENAVESNESNSFVKMKWKFLHNFTFNNLTSSSKENEAPLDSFVQQIKMNNKPIWKSDVNEKWAILF